MVNGPSDSKTHLFIGKALFSEDLQQWRGVAVSPLKHFPDDGQKVPDALWFPAPQRAQQACPLSSCRRLGGGQVHGVHITGDTHTNLLVKLLSEY